MNIPHSHPKRSKWIALGCVLMVPLTVIVAVFVFGRTNIVNANSTYFSLAEGKYPNMIGSRIDSCSFCHTGSIPSLNPYGAAFKTNGTNTTAFGLIEAIDSDGDGFTNLQEINALTYPGNAGDHPVTVPTATQVPTLAPTATKVPTLAPTATKVPPLAPTATKVPTQAPAATNVPTQVPAATKVSTQVPAVTKTTAPTRRPTATSTPGRIKPTPTPTCRNNDDDHSWFKLLLNFFRHPRGCSDDNHRSGDNHGSNDRHENGDD